MAQNRGRGAVRYLCKSVLELIGVEEGLILI